MPKRIPLSLYIHSPWCVKKCPYCDFNSHQIENAIPEIQYIQRLIADLRQDLIHVKNRPIYSIFFGGGTPSLLSPKTIETILNQIDALMPFDKTIEITLEANPGTVSKQKFLDYKTAGINRISLGAQSFNAEHLKILGRVHNPEDTIRAIESIVCADFNSFNIDIMYGLPQQSVTQSLEDLKVALNLDPVHLSWYHLTIEPNTIFYHQKPPLPTDEIIDTMQNEGYALLEAAGLSRYEVSAFSKSQHECRHNLNYWTFGDYLGIGAGAHAKITDSNTKTITRYWKTRMPKDYLDINKNLLAGSRIINTSELVVEFMLNNLRLLRGFSMHQFEQRTFLPIESIQKQLQKAVEQSLVTVQNTKIIPTDLGMRFLNDLTALFL